MGREIRKVLIIGFGLMFGGIFMLVNIGSIADFLNSFGKDEQIENVENTNQQVLKGYDAVKEHIDKVFNNYKQCIEKAKSNPNTEGRFNEYNKCYIWYSSALSIGRIKEECANEKLSDSQTQELIDYSDKKIKELPAQN